MFVPPEQRRSWQPPPDGGKPGSGDTVLLILVGLFAVSMLLAPMSGSNLLVAVMAVVGR